jgi:hypothetical protein
MVGCFFPEFTLERYEDKKWVIAGGPVCIDIAVPPQRIAHKQQYVATVKLYTDNGVVSGLYRMRFTISEIDYGPPIESNRLYSNPFWIIRQ